MKLLNTLNQIANTCYSNVIVSDTSLAFRYSSLFISFFKKIRLVFLNKNNQYVTCFKTNKSIIEYSQKTSLFLKNKDNKRYIRTLVYYANKHSRLGLFCCSCSL